MNMQLYGTAIGDEKRGSERNTERDTAGIPPVCTWSLGNNCSYIDHYRATRTVCGYIVPCHAWNFSHAISSMQGPVIVRAQDLLFSKKHY